MTKDEAEMWAAVARRIGLAYVECIQLRTLDRAWDEDQWGVFARGIRFDPPNNPADERMLWDFLSRGGFRVNTYITANDLDPVAVHRCRVTALGRAIYALPEVVPQ